MKRFALYDAPDFLTAAASDDAPEWRRSSGGYSLYATVDGVHVSIYRRPNSSIRFKLDGALPPGLTVGDGQAFVLALLAAGLDAARKGGRR